MPPENNITSPEINSPNTPVNQPSIDQPAANSIPQVVTATPSAINEPKKKKILIIATLLIILILIAGVAAYFLIMSKKSTNTESSNISSVNPLSASNVKPSNEATTSAGQGFGQADTISYDSPQQGYGFQYLKTWKIDKLGTLTVIVDPNNPNSLQCAANLSKFAACTVVISTVPYTSQTMPFDQQVISLATQMATDHKNDAITVGTLTGYSALSTSIQGSTFNVLLQGKKNIILVQFPNITNKGAISQGGNIILDSVVEE